MKLITPLSIGICLASLACGSEPTVPEASSPPIAEQQALAGIPD